MASVQEKVPVNLIQEAIVTAADFFPRLIDALTRVARDLQEDRLPEGLSLFHTAQDGLKWFCSMVELRNVWLGADSRTLDEQWPSFVDALARAADALADNDYVLLSDLLLYEAVPFMEEVLAAVGRLGEEPVRHAL